MRAPTNLSLPRLTAVDGPRGRECAQCGGQIDPIDWCPGCRSTGRPCRAPHRRLRRRADAAYCDDNCRARRRTTFITDCL